MSPDIMRRPLAFLIIVVFVVALGTAVVHHHGDEECHADCAFCLFLIHPAIADAVEDILVCGLPILPENPRISEVFQVPLWFKTAPLGRAPPYGKV